MMKIKQLEKKIGTLSNPSKMPAYAWGISAKKCITGSLLAKKEGTICNKCYALGGHYLFPVVANAHQMRLDAIELNVAQDYVSKADLAVMVQRMEDHMVRIENKLDQIVLRN